MVWHAGMVSLPMVNGNYPTYQLFTKRVIREITHDFCRNISSESKKLRKDAGEFKKLYDGSSRELQWVIQEFIYP